jgi:hypothetical protein
MRLIIFVAFMLLAGLSVAQSKKKKKEQNQNGPTSVDPFYPSETYAPKKSKKVKGPSYNAEQEFAERMVKLEKSKRKNEKMMDSPQYSDPSYFGHKRPPKKRKPGKMKFCKECGIRH